MVVDGWPRQAEWLVRGGEGGIAWGGRGGGLPGAGRDHICTWQQQNLRCSIHHKRWLTNPYDYLLLIIVVIGQENRSLILGGIAFLSWLRYSIAIPSWLVLCTVIVEKKHKAIDRAEDCWRIPRFQVPRESCSATSPRDCEVSLAPLATRWMWMGPMAIWLLRAVCFVSFFLMLGLQPGIYREPHRNQILLFVSQGSQFKTVA